MTITIFFKYMLKCLYIIATEISTYDLMYISESYIDKMNGMFKDITMN